MARNIERVRTCAVGVGVALLIGIVFEGCHAAEGEAELHMRNQYHYPSRRTCGIDSLYVVLKSSGTALAMSELEEKIRIGPQGASLRQLRDAATECGFTVQAVDVGLNRLMRSGSPAVLHVDGDHFIAVLGEESGRMVVFDNRIGLFDCTRDWFRDHYEWGGASLVLGNLPSNWWYAVRSPVLTGALLLGCVALFWPWRSRRGPSDGLAEPST